MFKPKDKKEQVNTIMESSLAIGSIASSSLSMLAGIDCKVEPDLNENFMKYYFNYQVIDTFDCHRY